MQNYHSIRKTANYLNCSRDSILKSSGPITRKKSMGLSEY
ncbi:MAG: hypothetical protein IJ911_05805 [Salinivirgaceae bacterium]|nr:hypothetical protein [Salinivirgaceae bacterium]